jgi:hypothetical protein
MNNVCLYNPSYKRYNTNPYSDFTFWEEIDAAAGGKPLQPNITPEQEQSIVDATNKQNQTLTDSLNAATAAAKASTDTTKQKQLYIAIGIIAVLILAIIYLKKRNG